MLVAAVLAVAAVIGAIVIVRPWASDPPASSEATVWQTITGDFAADGRLTASAALEAFAFVFDVQIPGVRIPAGVDGHDGPTSASGVVRWVHGRWDDLSEAQRTVVDRTLAPGPDDVVMEVALGSPATPVTVPSQLRRAEGSASNAPVRRAADDACDSGATAIAHAVCTDIVADIARIGSRLGLRTIHVGNPCRDPVCDAVVLRKVTIRLSNDTPKNVLASTVPVQNDVTYSPCNITVYRSAWDGVDPASVATSALHEILTHEVVHCYQNVIFANNATASAMPPWITEGTALWLASDDTHIEEPMTGSQWRKGWLGRPSFPLLERTYDAFGWFALLDHHRWNLWSLLPDAWRAAAASAASPSEPFIRVLDGDNLEIRRAWAPSIVREPSRGEVWETYGFGLPADARNFFPLIRASSTPTVGELPGRAALLTQVRATDGEILTVTTTGLAAASDGALNLPSFTEERFCTIEDCTCPTGTRLAGQTVAGNNITVPFMLSFSAPASGSSYAVTSETLEAVCATTDPLPPLTGTNTGDVPGPCAEWCAASNGDPHLVTVDGHRYDFQAAGEFVLLRDPGTGIEIQARQEPLEGSTVAAINTQIAVRTGDHRLSVSLTDSVLEIRVDGQITLAGAAVDLGPGADVEWGGNFVEIGLPDGTTVWVLGLDRYGIVVEIAPSDALRAGATGLLGPVAPGGAGLPALPDGTRLPRPADSHERFIDRNVRLADAWRVDAATDILDHPDGRVGDDHAVAGFPDEDAPSSLVELTDVQVAGAMSRCDGITDAVLWSQCVVDVALTGDGGFAQLYADAQQMIRAGATGGATPTSTPSSVPATAPGSMVDGPLPPVLDHITGVSGRALADDGTLYVSVQLRNNTFQLVAIDAATSTIEQRVDTDGGGPVLIAGDAVWLGDATNAGGCAVVRYEPSNLAETGRVPVPCWLSGVQIAPLGDAVWVLDVTGVAADATGAHLARIDPDTLAVGDRVEIPTSNGYLSASRSAIFYGDDDHGIDRLVDADRRLVPITGLTPGRRIVAGDGIWQETDQAAQLFDGHGAPVRTIDIDGTLVAADDDALYVELASIVDAIPQLWRYPLDGGAPTVVATAPTIGTGPETRTLTDAGTAPPLTAPGLIVETWVAFPTAGGGDAAMFLQTVHLERVADVVGDLVGGRDSPRHRRHEAAPLLFVERVLGDVEGRSPRPQEAMRPARRARRSGGRLPGHATRRGKQIGRRADRPDREQPGRWPGNSRMPAELLLSVTRSPCAHSVSLADCGSAVLSGLANCRGCGPG